MSGHDFKSRILQKALSFIKEQPSSIASALAYASSTYPGHSLTIEEVVRLVGSSGANDPLRLSLHQAFNYWDHIPDPDWASGTLPNSEGRRQHVYGLLALSQDQATSIDKLIRIYIAEHPTVIAVSHKLWYQGEKSVGGFYWKAYQRYLEMEGWSNEALLSLNESTKAVIERLSDPTQTEAYQAKGLVVGYVQSGKTANFTGVVARAADAGYRLVIVLTGTTEILRHQTQRRLDKEMIGREFLENDYSDDDERESFLSHSVLPSLQPGGYDWQRLTGPDYDYKSLKRGIDALEFEKFDRSKPIYDPVNLYRTKSRLIVVKKNAAILKKVLEDIRRIRSRLEEIPALIIDDESDQASLNTVNPEKSATRTTINDLIVRLLKALPRGQYVGYTATPFANVFVDPDNAEDLFPKDFLLTLPRPPGYMGVSDFYDLDAVDPEDERPNRDAFVRSVTGDDYAHDKNLTKAIDSFVLTGAIKLFRRARGIRVRRLQHHTMLVHLSSRTGDHKRDAAKIRELFRKSNYHSGGEGYDRLKLLYAEDIRPVSVALSTEMPHPVHFEELDSYLAEALKRIDRDGGPVAIVNSDRDSTALNFEKESIWRIIVGGTKLSRGFTVEGLTVSYYRRRTSTADTLMQMGRWFGYRQGYGDLVRLFIGTSEPINKRGDTIDLYEAFGAVCRDEESFRSELQRYASLEEPRVLPRDVPPLVASHLLRPTARNKMYNAKIVQENFGEQWIEATGAPTDRELVNDNWRLFDGMINGAKWERRSVEFLLGAASFTYEIACTPIANARVLEFLRKYKWLGDGNSRLARVNEFMSGTGESSPCIDRWLIIAPQRTRDRVPEPISPDGFSVFQRSRVSEGARFKAYTEFRHRILAEYLALGAPKDTTKGDFKVISGQIDDLKDLRQAVFLFYRVESNLGFKGPHPAFALLFPRNSIVAPIKFGVHDPRHSSAIVVDASVDSEEVAG